MKIVFFECDAAAVMAEITEVGDGVYRLPEPNREYRYGMIHQGITWASRDQKNWVVAISFVIDGQRRSPDDIIGSIGEGACYDCEDRES